MTATSRLDINLDREDFLARYWQRKPLFISQAVTDFKPPISAHQLAGLALEQEIEFLGPTRVKDVEDAQAKVVAEVRRLEEAGEIVISGGEDDVLV